MTPTPKRTCSINLPQATWEALKADAAKQRRSVSAVVGMVVEEWMERQRTLEKVEKLIAVSPNAKYCSMHEEQKENANGKERTIHE